jgi:hypothetical protein
MLILTGTHNEITTANGSAYSITLDADGTGVAMVDRVEILGQVIDQFRFARITFEFVGGELRAVFHGTCLMDRNPVEFDRPGARVRMTSRVIDVVAMG